MSKLPYHCKIDQNRKGLPIALCGYRAPNSYNWRKGEHAFDGPTSWFNEWKGFNLFWGKYERCPDCMAHEDYPLIALANV